MHKKILGFQIFTNFFQQKWLPRYYQLRNFSLYIGLFYWTAIYFYS